MKIFEWNSNQLYLIRAIKTLYLSAAIGALSLYGANWWLIIKKCVYTALT